MYALLIALLTLFIQPETADSIKVETEIGKVTVFRNQAQIHREEKITLKKGKQTVVFTGLSEFLIPESIQIKANGSFTLLSLNSQTHYSEETIWREDVQELREQRKVVQKQHQKKQTELEVLKKEETMLHSTTNIINNNKLSSVELEQLLELYREKLSEVLNRQNEVRDEIDELQRKLTHLDRQIAESGVVKSDRSMEVVAEVMSDDDQELTFYLSYLVTNAGWNATYDLRSQDIDSPLSITYKANIWQQTGIDWKDITFTINSGDPASNSTKPELSTNYVGYYNRYRNSGRRNNSTTGKVSMYQTNNRGLVEGIVIDSRGETLPAVNVLIEELGRGTTTDIDGKFRLEYIPNGTFTLKSTFIGFQPHRSKITIYNNGLFITTTMEEDIMGLEEVVVNAAPVRVAGVNAFSDSYNEPPKPKVQTPDIIYNEEISNQTSFSYEIGIPYSVPSNGKEHTVEIKREEVETKYEFASAPKLSKFAYLIGTLPDWSSLNLIEGEANIYFDNSFVGSTWLNPTSIDDSLTVSLGKDERIVVEREQLKEFSSKNFFRNKTRETFSYEIRVRNTKSEPIKITVEDQLPVSTNEEIKVTAKDLGDGYMREETGIVYWEIELQPGETKKLPLVYELEYPKGKRVAF
tara:strand:+ start:446 stop:2353 length:1908 start_codon:yes stop_codon:yes gene_type:complete